MLVSAVILYSSVPYFFGVDVWLAGCGCDQHHDRSSFSSKGFVSPPISWSQSCLREVRKEVETGAEAETMEEGGPLLTVETDHDKRSVDLVALCGTFA